MTMRRFALFSDTSAQAATEMVLVMPILLAILFGAAEVGYYFYQEHIVVDAVRDGARVGARQPLEDVGCGGVDPAAETSIKAATRLTSPNAADEPENRRLYYWDSDESVTVAVTCVDNDGYAGVYSNLAQLPRIRVSADVAYPTLLSTLGIGDLTLSVRAASEAAMVGS
jgi:Flp pilus assembly protein TadG